MKYFDFADFLALIKWLFIKEQTKFENEFAEYIGCNFALGTSFGRTALFLGLKAIDANDKEVIIPSFTCTVVRHAVTVAGATPVFVDIDPKTLDFNLEDLKKKISKKTKAIVLTHYFGRVARNIEDIINIAKQNGLFLIEDCAHSIGAEYKNQKIGTFGDLSIFSLTKSILNFGGGVLITNQKEIYKNAKQIMGNEKIPFKQRFVDFPLIVSYGLEQIIDKLVLDRVGKSIFKWWIIYLPKVLLVTREYVIKIIKSPLAFSKGKTKEKRQLLQSSEKSVTIGYKQGISMEPIIASLARTQLKKIDSLIEQRKETSKNLSTLENVSFKTSEDNKYMDVHTHIVLKFPQKDIFSVLGKSKKDGLLLRTTWPTHQRIWQYQDTKNLRKIEKEILTYNVNPVLTKEEEKMFIQIIRKSYL